MLLVLTQQHAARLNALLVAAACCSPHLGDPRYAPNEENSTFDGALGSDMWMWTTVLGAGHDFATHSMIFSSGEPYTWTLT